MKILIANTIIFILIILVAIFAYFKIANAVEMSASVPETSENCYTTCRTICDDKTIEFTKDYYKEIIKF